MTRRIPLRSFRTSAPRGDPRESNPAVRAAALEWPVGAIGSGEPAVLVAPDDAASSARRCGAAVALDHELVTLSGLDARCRIVRARITARLMDLKGWRLLGFARLGDFARERLGTSARTLEEDARVIRAADRLPLLRRELESGRIAWTRARLLVRVATPENESALIEESSRVAYRDLEDFVRAFAQRGRDISSDPANAPAGIDQEPAVRWSIEVSRSGRQMWREACEYASRSAGSPLSQAQVLELVAAEAASTRAGNCPNATPTTQDHERRFLAPARRRDERGRSLLYDALVDAGVAEGFPWLAPTSVHPGPELALDSLQSDLERCDARELERRLQRLRLAMQNTDAQIASLLKISIDRRLYLEIGFANLEIYVEARLGMSGRRMWSLVKIERASLRHCTKLREAWRDGRLSMLRALALLPVLGTNNADAWIARAGEVTFRRLQEEVTWALDQSRRDVLPPSSNDVLRTAAAGAVELAEVQNRARPGEGPAPIRPPGAIRLSFHLPVLVAVLVESTLDVLATPGEPRWSTFERMVALALSDWMATPRHRDPIFERDGWRCTVPGCSSRRNLHDHHLVFRSHGGTNFQDNRTTICASHHLHGIHAGIIRAEGRAPDDIRWEMPLGTFVGDRHVDGG